MMSLLILSTESYSGTIKNNQYCFSRPEAEKFYSCLKEKRSLEEEVAVLSLTPPVEEKTFFDTDYGKAALIAIGFVTGYALRSSTH